MTSLDPLLRCTGQWRGRNVLRVQPDAPADESDSTLRITPILRGTFVRIDQTWQADGTPQEGSMLIGLEPASNSVALHWIDTWHMGRKVMLCTGLLGEDGSIDTRGSYAAPPGPDWGWRIQIAAKASERVEIRMFNVDPSGKEELAVLATYSPAA